MNHSHPSQPSQYLKEDHHFHQEGNMETFPPTNNNNNNNNNTNAPENITGQKRRFSTSCLSMKTVLRWRITGDVNIDHLFGCSDTCSYEEKARADELLRDSGQLICILCNTPISANKKAVRRHQIKNRNHLNLVQQLSNGIHVIDRNNTLLTAQSAHLRPMSIKKFTGEKVESIPITSDPFQGALTKEAWDIICAPEKLTNSINLANLLSTLGICEGKDLLYCEEREIIDIGMHMKNIPRRRFLQIFGISIDDHVNVHNNNSTLHEDDDEDDNDDDNDDEDNNLNIINTQNTNSLQHQHNILNNSLNQHQQSEHDDNDDNDDVDVNNLNEREKENLIIGLLATPTHPNLISDSGLDGNIHF